MATLMRNTPSDWKPKSSKEIASEAVALIMEFIEENKQLPWRQPWRGTTGDLATSHHNAFTRHFYKGLNPLILELTARKKGFSSKRWCTFGQAKKAGGQVRKGEKSVGVTFWKFEVRRREIIDDETGEMTSKAVRVPLLRQFRVFNTDQVDGLKLRELPQPATPKEPIAAAQAIADGYTESNTGPRVDVNGFDAAFYRPDLDAVEVPSAAHFDRHQEFYSTLFHELGHSTGHKSRLNREGVTSPIRFGSHRYSREELIAEFAAAILCANAGIIQDTYENSASYLAGWAEKLRDDPMALIVGAGGGEKAAAYILAASEAPEAPEAPEAAHVERELVAA